MNVYEKLQCARVELQSMDIKKSGENKFSHYTYFELSDFLSHITRIFDQKKLASVVSFTDTLASLTIINAEKPDERIEFTSPMRSAELKGCHDIQNLGAVETYQRRYLYVTALEIAECDALDPLPKGDNPTPEKHITREQGVELAKLCKDIFGADSAKEYMQKIAGSSNYLEISASKFDKIKEEIMSHPKGKEPCPSEN